MIIIPMLWQDSEVQVLQYTSDIIQVVVIYWNYLMACKYESWKLAMDDHELTKILLIILFGCNELIELDIYAYVACYEMFEWINCLVIKFGLICVG
jgi:hypothetical protein